MKKIAFFVQHMLCGGVENALIALSKKLVDSGNDVTIYVIRNRGMFMSKIPFAVHQTEIPMPNSIRKSIPVGGTKIAIHDSLQAHHYLVATKYLFAYAFAKSKFAELNVDFNKIPDLDEKYDIAVNFHMHSPFLVRYLSEKVKAEKKLTWIHNDFTTTHYKIKDLQKYLECCSGFYGVSQRVVDEFVEIFPEYRGKTHVALNIVPVKEILKKADTEKPKEYDTVPSGFLKLLSVGRLEEQKGYELTIKVCKQLVDKGDKFKWFILGEGTQRSKLESQIKKYGLENVLLLLGVRMNPYPYFKNCNIYVQTSLHEGYVTTVTEAKIFCKPIVCTDVSGVREQLTDENTGDIAAIDVNDITGKLHRLINEPKRRDMYSKILAYSNINNNYDWFNVFEV